MSDRYYNEYKNYDQNSKKQLMLKILDAEKKRQDEIKILISELRSLEERLEICSIAVFNNTNDFNAPVTKKTEKTEKTKMAETVGTTAIVNTINIIDNIEAVEITDRIDEIINKLNLIDPLAENKNIEFAEFIETNETNEVIKDNGYNEFEKLRQKRMKIKNIAGIYKITAVAACVVIVFLISVFAFNTDILNIFTDSDSEQEQDYAEILDNEDFGIRQYDTILEFETEENINLFDSWELPDDMEVKNVIYFYNYGINQVTILFDDNTSMSVKLSTNSIYDNNYIPLEISD